MEPVRTGFSTYIFEGDGATNVFPLQFTLGELKRSYVTCQVADEVDGLGNPVYRELIEVPGDPSMIQIAGAVPAVGDKIEFRRVVPKDLLLHLYANGSILDYPSLDESHLQLMMVLHEVLDGVGLKNVYNDINMHGYKLTNVFSDPNDPDSIATVAFLGTYRQDALDAAVAAANSAVEALGYRNAAQHSAIEAAGYRNTALMHANTAAQHADSAADSAAAAEAISIEVAARAYNRIINGNFDIWQRGTSQTVNGYGSVDGWASDRVGSNNTISRQVFVLGQSDVPHNPVFFVRNTVTSVAGASNYAALAQKVEDVRTLSGGRATFSFWAKADANRNIALDFAQSFGTGGSPSAFVTGIGKQIFTLTTVWQKFTVTFDVPSVSGKTLGSDGNNCLIACFWFDAGANFAARTSGLGQQSGTFDIANVSLIEGDIDVKPIPRSYGEELALCQRYYSILRLFLRFQSTGSSSVLGALFNLPTRMRAAPILSAATGVTQINAPTSYVSISSPLQVKYEIQAGAAGDSYREETRGFDAEL